MSVRRADAPALRRQARALRTAAARTGLEAWSLRGLTEGTEPHWWGGHAVLWHGRARAAEQALRADEERLRRVADGAARYAEAVADAQARLDVLDREEEQVRADGARALARWDAEPAAVRGPRPAPGPGLAALDGRRAAVEEAADLEARRFARAVDGALDGLSRSRSPVDAFRWATGHDVYRGIATSTAVRDLVATTRRGADVVGRVGRRAPAVLKAGDRLLGPVGVVSDVDTLLHPPGWDGSVREWATYGAAAASIGTKGAVVVGAAAGVTTVAGISLPAAAGATAVAVTVYAVGKEVHDAVRGRTAPPARTAAAAAARRAPAPRVPRPAPAPRVAPRGAARVAA